MTRKKFITATDLKADSAPLLHNPAYFIDRLKAAEDALLMYGWSASVRRMGERERATYNLWCKWLELVGGNEFSWPRNHPHLSDADIRRLASEDEDLERRTREKIDRIVVEVPA